ncbi:ribbon-helix-helix domain-containing protein [Thermococcus indicus]|uniref:ribbon-helix-helix domain-containing protein n=1 Tax=Thermococcus indicus TaxID=2586643 RepID=UPI00197CB6F0|nr:ribbon-helix-helix domain-containing protein [Thermococcus indicus]
MGKMMVSISDEVEQEFRELVAKRYGLRRGALSIAVEEALRLWIIRTKAELEAMENSKAVEEVR